MGTKATEIKGGFDIDNNVVFLPVFVDSPSCEPIFYEAEYEWDENGEIDYLKNSVFGICDFPVC